MGGSEFGIINIIVWSIVSAFGQSFTILVVSGSRMTMHFVTNQSPFQIGLSVLVPPHSTTEGCSETLPGCGETEDRQHEYVADESAEITSRRTKAVLRANGGPLQYHYGVPNEVLAECIPEVKHQRCKSTMYPSIRPIHSDSGHRYSCQKQLSCLQHSS